MGMALSLSGETVKVLEGGQCPLLKKQEETDSSKWKKLPEFCVEMLNLNPSLGSLF